jgi:D-glycero-alpha-D-manno-heptose-7-phosphate kinase
MIITRTPMRVSLLGGGTDLPEYYKRHGRGSVLSGAIDKYVTVIIHKRCDRKIRINVAAAPEEVDSVDNVSHQIIRESLVRVGLSGGVEITSVSDVVGGNGLGSSSSFTVGLYHALSRFMGMRPSRSQILNESFNIERNLCGRRVGLQDHAAAVYGGVRLYYFPKSGHVRFEDSIGTPQPFRSFRLFDTGVRRSADDVLGSYSFDECCGDMAEAARTAASAFYSLRVRREASKDLFEKVNAGWNMKKRFSSSVASYEINSAVELAFESGAECCKVLGAGGGGFLLVGGWGFRVPDWSLSELPFEFTDNGTYAVETRNASNKQH